MPKLTIKQRLIVWYVVLSLFLATGISEETNFFVSLLIVANFANSVRLLNKSGIPDDEDEDIV